MARDTDTFGNSEQQKATSSLATHAYAPNLNKMSDVLFYRHCLAGPGYVYLPCTFHDSSVRPLIVQQAALVQEPLQLLAALPAVWFFLENKSPNMAGSAALICLEAVQKDRDRWRSALQSYDLCRSKLLCQHVGDSCASLTRAGFALILAGLEASSRCILHTAFL